MEKANQNEKLYAYAVTGAQRETLSALDAQNTAPDAAADAKNVLKHVLLAF